MVDVDRPQSQRLFVGMQEVQPPDGVPLDSSSSSTWTHAQSNAHVQSQLALGNGRSSECAKCLQDGSHDTVNDTSLREALSEVGPQQAPPEFDLVSISSLAYTCVCVMSD